MAGRRVVRPLFTPGTHATLAPPPKDLGVTRTEGGESDRDPWTHLDPDWCRTQGGRRRRCVWRGTYRRGAGGPTSGTQRSCCRTGPGRGASSSRAAWAVTSGRARHYTHRTLGCLVTHNVLEPDPRPPGHRHRPISSSRDGVRYLGSWVRPAGTEDGGRRTYTLESRTDIHPNRHRRCMSSRGW